MQEDNNNVLDYGPDHKAGYISIIGKPNVGKSTLMNQLVGERLSIITSKAQTTRHRILGILNGANFQLVYSDTPGIILPQYELHKSMMQFVNRSLEDADVILFVTDIYEKHDENDVLTKLSKSDHPVIVLVNKVDQATDEEIEEKLAYWKENVKAVEYLPISALNGVNIDKVFNLIIKHTPKHPPYYPKDTLTDKPERFFVSEFLREAIFKTFKKEVPYSCEVVVEEFKESEDIIRMRAIIYVERDSQKGIIIGKGGAAIKKIGIMARESCESFFDKHVHLETHVKVEADWRKRANKLASFGYNPKA